MLEYIWLIPIFPLIGFIINGIIGFRINRHFVSMIGCGSVFLSFLISLFAFRELILIDAEQRFFHKVLYSWISVGSFNASFGFQLDPLSAVMVLVVTGVGFIIHVYSIGYMENDPGYPRYFSFLNLFMFSMLVLVLADNFLLLFVGWEAVGLCSYLLIGYWYEKKSASDAGKKAFIVNRIGDFGFIIGVILIFSTFGTVEFRSVFEKLTDMVKAGSIDPKILTLICLLLFAGATGKSAQIPLYVWLPDAMEGPTPVSALIHAATMVTAGVYMICRACIIFAYAPYALDLVAFIGALTAIFAASIGLVQNDIKRVLAYSTISQLGYMFLACGVGAFAAGIFHLTTHAFFKALLFLGAGSVMHALEGETDIMKMGALKEKMRITHMTFLIGSLAIAGIFPFSGFFSKDAILAGAFERSTYLWLMGVFGALLTAFYMFRLVFLTFYGESRIPHEMEHHIHESPAVMTIPLIILAILSVTGGFIGIPLIEGGNRIGEFLDPVFHHANSILGKVHHEAVKEISLMVISLLVALFGIYLAIIFYLRRTYIPSRLEASFPLAYRLIFNKYYVDEIYEYLFVNSIKSFSVWLWEFIDTLVIDGAVNGIAYLTKGVGNVVRKIQTGYVQGYALSIVIGAFVILAYYFLRMRM
uniref:NADH dehydrogenase I subunit L n=1 Tax=uncultured prokaryote TaxID=198431 RepID=H5SP78_9ZZZZ|nr:NADH dehydrogenase I subunit L [uncultured prokaryote]